MNESISVLLATTILALGGLGLYMYKSSKDDIEDETENEYNEASLFDSFRWFSLGEDDDKDKDIKEDKDEDITENEIIDTDVKHRKKSGKNTLKNKQASSTSRRRH